MKTFNRKYLKQRRRYLRNNLTSAEATLWKALQSSQLEGRKFRRQAGIGNYIVDFYCPKEKLVLELDGNYHLEMINSEYDTERTRYLERIGLKVLRFKNDSVLKNLDWVLEEIVKSFI